MKKGIVYLVGAGPGDPELLTLKGRRCLASADIVVGDYLADRHLLALASPDAEYIYVGKKAGNHAMKQEEISRLLVHLAGEGKTVVRLKGGDPLVFGRGAEEAALLAENSIPFEIVPGITSAIAAAAYAGIPVTSRGVSASFAVITGHEDPAKKNSAIHWDALAHAVDTLVILMGVSRLPYITGELIRYGKSPDTPAALVRWGTKPEQKVLVTTLGKAADDCAEAGMKPPAVLIVGPVVNLRNTLQWFDNRPLFGKTILVTRARTQASRLSSALSALGASCLEIPAISIQDPCDHFQELDRALSHMEHYGWILFTSVNGVSRFFSRLALSGRDSRCLCHSRIGAIGSATAEALKKQGISADCVPSVFRAESFLESLKPHIQAGTEILIPRAEKARDVLPEGLRALGAHVHIAAAYRTETAADETARLRSILTSGNADLITFTSSSTVENVMKMISGHTDILQSVPIACIGPITADTCRRFGLTPAVTAETYTIAGLCDAIQKWSENQ